MLSEAQLRLFETEGYLVVEDFATLEETAALRARAAELLKSYDPTSVSLFSSSKRSKIKSASLKDSAYDIAFFLEEGAVDDDGELTFPKELAVNKIGHALHDLDPVFRRFSRSNKMAGLFRSLNYKRPIPVQSMYICKQPKIGGYVIPHQDNSFLFTEPLSTIGVWVALEDATLENGCLFVAPGSHKAGLKVRFGREGEEALKLLEGDPEADCDLEAFRPCPVKEGTLVLLHGCVVHYSNENSSEKSRHAYSVHVVESGDGYEWKKENWLQREPEHDFEPLY